MAAGFFLLLTPIAHRPGRRFAALALALAGLLFVSHAVAYTGRVVDAATGKGIADALVTLSGDVVRTDREGRFEIEGKGDTLAVRASGYRRLRLPVGGIEATPEIELSSFKPKALYLSFYGVGSRTLRESALALIRDTELNAVVIDIKGDRGMVAYPSAVQLAREVGAQRLITTKDVKGLIASLHQSGVYTIARIVAFKDDPLATARPDLAVKTAAGRTWRDREGLAWADPFRREVWDYNIALAVEAAQNGFDEIQFDYARFPDADGLAFSMPNTEKNRVRAITEFLTRARRALVPYNVFLAVDIFGYVCWNLDDTGVGQRLEEMAPLLDYISPMLYPSGFHQGIPDYRNPVAHPYEVVYLSLKRAEERTHLPAASFRPWLQAFRDYAFDRRPFEGKGIRAQIDGAERFGSDGWMLWNPRNVYSAEGLRKR